jgi:uncharacterized iron-regulated membrane protein
MFQATILRLHRWLALAATLPLLLLGLSGAILTFENELDRALNPQLWSVPVREPAGNWQDLVNLVARQYPRDRVGSLRLPAVPGRAAELSLGSGLLVYCDPYDGRILGSRRRPEILMARIHQFHTNLLVGKSGSLVMGSAAVALVLLSLSGLPLWWKTKLAWLRSRPGKKRFQFDLHNVLGIYSVLFWLTLGLTGGMMTFEHFAEPAVYWLTRSKPIALPSLRSTPQSDEPPQTIDAALEAARAALPGATVSFISLPKQPKETFAAFMKFPEDRTPAGRSRVFLDQFSGRVLWVTNTRDVPRGTWIWNQHRSLHTGDQFGWPTRLLMGLASLLLAVQAFTGLTLWWRGRARGDAAQ